MSKNTNGKPTRTAAKAKPRAVQAAPAANDRPPSFLDHRRRFALIVWLAEQRNMLDNLVSELYQHNKLGQALGEDRAKDVRQRLRDAMENLQLAVDECVDNVRPSLEYYLLDLDD